VISIEPLLEHVAPFALVVSRIAGLMVLTPLLANRLLPRRFRALIAIMFAAAVYPGLAGQWHLAPDADLVTLLPLLASELLIGVSIGFLAGLPIVGLDAAAYLMCHQMGLGLARVYNPEVGEDTDIMGQLLMYIGLAIFVSIGGLESMFLALMSTFEQVPVGAFAADRLPMDVILGVLSSAFELAIRVSAPVLCIVLLLMIAMGFVMKTMPQINILSVGFALKIIFGLGILILALIAIQSAATDEIIRVTNLIVQWAQSL
jgi:flagellar biosynthesis protein FliR